MLRKAEGARDIDPRIIRNYPGAYRRISGDLLFFHRGHRLSGTRASIFTLVHEHRHVYAGRTPPCGPIGDYARLDGEFYRPLSGMEGGTDGTCQSDLPFLK